MDDIHAQWKGSLKPDQKKRTYGHFDAPLDLDDENVFRRVIGSLRHIRSHHFLPLVKFIKKEIKYRRGENGILRRSKKHRPIMYSSHLDSHIYSFYAYLWAKKYEDFLCGRGMEANILAYRKSDDLQGKSNIHFAKEVFEFVKRMGECSVITADISKFFDTLNHGILKESLSEILGKKLVDDEYKILRSLTRFRYIFKESHKKRSRKKSVGIYSGFVARVLKEVRKGRCPLAQIVYELGSDGFIKENRTSVGIPQGTPLSGLLANVYMSRFDSEFVRDFPDVLYRRYSDDVVFVCRSSDAERVWSSVCKRIKKVHLDINPSKAFIATFRRSGDSIVCDEVKSGYGKLLGRKYVDYLGFELSGVGNFRVRQKTVQKARRKAKKKIERFLLRQTPKNPRKLHNRILSQRNGRGTNAYIERARRIMGDAERHGIGSQQETFRKFVRKTKALKGEDIRRIGQKT
jgi:RNA-directed DNA polymerase